MLGLVEMSEKFYGFGRWDAPYWFIGPEQGMKDVGDGLDARCRCWQRLGSQELADCIAYHRCLGYTLYHQPPFCLQPTWKRLILLLLVLKGEVPHKAAIRAYQATKWGTTARDGETCVIDLSALAAPNLSVPRDRRAFREHRISVLRERISQNKPKAVVMYGIRNKPDFMQIAGGPFDEQGIGQLGSTVVMHTPAPIAFGYTDEDWIMFGLQLRQLCAEVRNEENHMPFVAGE